MASEIKLQIDSSRALADLKLFLAEVANRPAKVSQAFIDRFEALIKSGGIDIKNPVACGASGLLFELELTDAFFEFMAATRAGDFDVV